MGGGLKGNQELKIEWSLRDLITLSSVPFQMPSWHRKMRGRQGSSESVSGLSIEEMPPNGNE